MRIHSLPLWAAVGLSTASAAADEIGPFDDLHGREPPVEDLAPSPLVPLEPEHSARPSVSLGLTWVERPTRRDVAGGIVLSFPTDVAVPRPKAKTALEEEEKSPSGDEPSAESTMVRAAPRRVHLPRIAPRVARAAIAAALRERGHGIADERIDDLATRARWSAILPEVRLRATRQVDESSSLSPTSYDPQRTTSTGGVSLWLEGRTTWYFDRLVFADEEVRIEALRRELSQERERIRKRVLELLFGWQRAAARARDPLLDPQRCVEALLDEEQHAIELDVMTGGWFSRWSRAHPLRGVDCSEREPPPPPDEEVHRPGERKESLSYAEEHGSHARAGGGG
jgi:hypothetical protein